MGPLLRSHARSLLLLVSVAASACGTSSPADGGNADVQPGADVADSGNAPTDATNHTDTGTPVDTGNVPTPDAGPPTGNNVVTAIVDDGPSHSSTDTLYVSITLCRPGTTTCQTIDHIQVDTGSSGLRVVGSVLNPSLGLTNETAPGGGTLVECFQFADGYTWGPVATADLQVGGETAHNVALQVIGTSSFGSIPSDCSSSGPSENTVQDFGGNGLIGIGTDVQDCGDYCADPANPAPGSYYWCTGTTCNIAVVPDAQQLLNPVTLFPTDNNGSVVQLPTLAAGGAATASGYVIFGIGTQSNNALGAATVLTVDPSSGSFTTTYNGQTMAQSFIDSGSNAYYFRDGSITACADAPGFDCPTSTMTLSAVNTGQSGATSSVTFRVGNADAIFNNALAASDALAGDGDPSGFDWGLPFFFGRSIFTAISGASTPGGTGPYFAY